MHSISLSKLQLFSGLSLILIGGLGRFFMLKFVGIPNFEIITALTLVSAVFLGGVWTLIVPLSIIAITDVFIGNSPVLIFTWSAFAIIGIFGWLSRGVILKDSSTITMSLRGAHSLRSVQAPRLRGKAEANSPLLSQRTIYEYNWTGFLAEFTLRNRRARNRLRNPVFIAKTAGLPRSLRSLAMTLGGMTFLGIGSSVFFFLYTNFGWWLVSGMYPHTFEGLMQCYIMGIPFFKNNLIGNLIFVPMFSSIALGMVWLSKKLPQVPFSEKILKRFSKNY